MATPVEDTLTLVNGLARIAVAHRLDKIAVGDVTIIRTQHISAEDIGRAAAQAAQRGEEEEEDLLFHSSGTGDA